MQITKKFNGQLTTVTIRIFWSCLYVFMQLFTWKSKSNVEYILYSHSEECLPFTAE